MEGWVSPMKRKKKYILVIDDDVSITKLLKANLEQTNDYVVRAVNQGPLAVTVAEEFEPDLILLDVMMPEIDGGELAVELHARPKLKHIPIVFLTAAVSRKEVAEHGGQIGGAPFIAKPVSIPDLIRRIEENLEACPESV
jgi:CheY-like chemotaxis protein